MANASSSLLHDCYEKEHGPTPKFAIPGEIADLAKGFIVMSIIYFLIAGSLAIVMRLIQSKVMLAAGNQNQTFGLFYASLTVHGQLMFFGFASMLVVGISYYLLCKFAKKPLASTNLAIGSFVMLNAGAILIIVSGTMFFGAGWYDLMPLPFKPGNNGWSTLAAVVFLLADLFIGIGLTLFSIDILATALRGKIAAGLQNFERVKDASGAGNNNNNTSGRGKEGEGEGEGGREESMEKENEGAATMTIIIMTIATSPGLTRTILGGPACYQCNTSRRRQGGLRSLA
jgi:hypothetical protein